MKKKRFTEEQIIGILREQEAGAKVADLARKHAVSEATLYDWKAKLWGHGRFGSEAAESAGGGERQAEEVLARIRATSARGMSKRARRRGSNR